MKKLAALASLFAAFAVSAATLTPVQLLNPSGSTAGQAIVSTGSSTAPGWANVTASSVTPIASNSVYGNFTGATASPTANAVPSCSTANSALKFTTSTGLSCGSTFALTTSDLSQFAATTSAQLRGIVSDETGSGALVFATSPTLTTPSFSSIVNTGTLTLPTSTDTLVGRATTDTLTNKTLTSPTINGAALSGTLSGTPTFSGAVAFSSTITPSQTAGIVGTTTNNSANAGSVGEYVPNSASGVALTTNVATNVTSISLTAGDWNVWGATTFVPAGGAAMSAIYTGVSTTSATLPAAPDFSTIAATLSAFNQTLPAPMQRISVAATTTVYLIGQVAFSGGSVTATGAIRARRVR